MGKKKNLSHKDPSPVKGPTATDPSIPSSVAHSFKANGFGSDPKNCSITTNGVAVNGETETHLNGVDSVSPAESPTPQCCHRRSSLKSSQTFVDDEHALVNGTERTHDSNGVSTETEESLNSFSEKSSEVVVDDATETSLADATEPDKGASSSTSLTTPDVCSDTDVTYVVYESELQMPNIMRLIQKDLSEPYSIYTYRYFIHNWPHLCFMVIRLFFTRKV